MTTRYQQDLFLASAPRKPYCADDLGSGVRIRSQRHAVRHRHIQHNPPGQLAFLVFDFDRAGALIAAVEAGLPSPSWVAENRDTRRGHIAYALVCPVITTDAARAAPMRYAAAVEQGYRDTLRADAGYAGFLTKTPGHEAWRTEWGRPEPFTLEELADYLPHGLPRLKPKREEASGLGRNVCLFENLRRWSYRARLRYDDANEWHAACLDYALGVNGGFSSPLPDSEVRATAKSAAKWVWQKFNAAAFSAIQTSRSTRASTARKSDRMDRLQRLLDFTK